MMVNIASIQSILSVFVLFVLLVVLVRLSLVLVRVRRLVERLEILSDIKGWLSFFRRDKQS